MARNTARALAKQAPVAYEAPEDDWQPLHPLHRRLVDEYTGAAAPARNKPRFGMRLAVLLGLAIASWAVVAIVVRLAFTAF